MNFFGKINVELGKDLQDKVTFLNNAEFPKIGFLERLSISKDGGQEEVDRYEDRTKMTESQINEQKRQRILQSENEARQTSSLKISLQDSRFGQVMFLNDTITRAPDQFYKFYEVSRNTRTRLVKTNKDLFIIWGQNGFIATLFCLAYLLVWLTGIGSSKKKAVKILIFLQRQLFILFTVNLQFVSLTQLALHDIRKEEQG